MEKQLSIRENFHLVERQLKTEVVQQKTVSTPVNHIMVIDCSGSMSYELPNIRKQLKNKLSNLMKDGDTISIIWFSGRNDCGILKEEVEVKSLKTLQDLNDSIDRWLKPVGLTAFNPPLVLAKQVIERIRKNRPQGIFSLMYLTDGYNNDSSWSDVTNSLKALETDLAASTFVEYGYYADTQRLNQMAELVGGEKVMAESFDAYDVVFENKISKGLSSSGKKQLVDIEPEYRKFDFAFAVNDDDEVIVYGITDKNQILIPEDVENIYYFTTSSKKISDSLNPAHDSVVKALYASIYILAEKMKTQEAEDIYAVLGDKYTFDLFVNAFGKQKLNAFKNVIKDCIVDVAKRFQQGRVDNLVIDSHAYCVMTMIQDLSAFEDNLFYPNHTDFNYKRIGQKKVQKTNTEFSDEDKTRIAAITDITELKVLVEELTKKYSDFELKFENTNPDKGFQFTNLVWNEERANLSVMVRYEGKVKLPTNQFGIDEIDTFIYRNYTIIKDGILNLTKLPVSLNKHTFNILKGYGLISDSWAEGKVLTVDYAILPVVNRSMTTSVSAEELARTEFELLSIQGDNKVYKYYEELHFPRESKGFVDQYGPEAEQWLKTLGITEFNGFAPKTEFADSTDFYMSVTLETKIAGYSSIPPVKNVEPKLVADINAALKPAEGLLAPAIKDYLTQTTSKIYTTQTPELQKEILKTWLKDSKTKANIRRRELLQKIAQIKFGLILSRGWFKEFSSIDENELDLELIKDSSPIKVKFVLGEKEEKI
jgi:Mg-chelatase subunit ChlD